VSVLTIRPNATGASAQHSRNGGTSNFGRCSEITSDGDTTYCYNLTAGDGGIQFKTDLYNLANSGGEVGAITLVKLYVVARYDILDAGGMALLGVRIRVGTTTYAGSTVDLTGDYTAYTAQWATNPAGGNWTWAAINALQAGYLTTCQDGGGGPTTEARVTQVYVEVTFNRAFAPSSPALIVVAGLQPYFAHLQRFEPAASAIVSTAALQPDFAHRQRFEPTPAVVSAAALQPLFQHHQLFAPEDPALVQVLGTQPDFQHHQLFAPEDPALVQVLGAQPDFQHHKLFTPADSALVQVLSLQPDFRHGEPPDQSTPFSLVSQFPDAFMRTEALADFSVETRAVDYLKETRL